ncbi:MAG TPA: hypothetical protein QF665_00295 [Alphaproteobacteria bacterium]|nr:hypothetical protein [Alphaproteobacteria bacterium]
MFRTLRLYAFFALPAVLAACSGLEVGRAEKIDVIGSPFQVALYREYLVRAQAEFAESDYADADKFALRAITAGSANDVRPESIGARNLPADARPALIRCPQQVAVRARPYRVCQDAGIDGTCPGCLRLLDAGTGRKHSAQGYCRLPRRVLRQPDPRPGRA